MALSLPFCGVTESITNFPCCSGDAGLMITGMTSPGAKSTWAKVPATAAPFNSMPPFAGRRTVDAPRLPTNTVTWSSESENPTKGI
jgi:hypothetical protein